MYITKHRFSRLSRFSRRRTSSFWGGRLRAKRISTKRKMFGFLNIMKGSNGYASGISMASRAGMTQADKEYYLSSKYKGNRTETKGGFLGFFNKRKNPWGGTTADYKRWSDLDDKWNEERNEELRKSEKYFREAERTGKDPF